MKITPYKLFSVCVLALSMVLVACGSAMPTQAPAAPAPTAVFTLGPTAGTQSRTFVIFAAASLTQAFGEIGKAFEGANPGVRVTFNFAGSQTLRTQLEQGASADVFASANHTEMDTAVKDNLIQQGVAQDLLTNKLVVILPANNPANVHSLQDLSRSGLKVILAAAAVPAGNYARQILTNISKDPAFGTDYGTKVLANVVSNENDVKQIVAKVQLGEADAGMVYVSDSIAAPDLKTIEIPTNFNVIAKYSIAPLMKSGNPDLAAKFVAYVLSADAQATLKKWGFIPIR